MFSDRKRRQAIIDSMRELERLGLNSGTAGNISTKNDDTILITPSSVPSIYLKKVSIVAIKNGIIESNKNPSTEYRLHKDIYDVYPEISSVVHCHSPFAVAVACQAKPIPAFHYMIAAFGGDSIPCANYATFGTQELSDFVVGTLKGISACLIANHGQVAVGTSLKDAMRKALLVEDLCKQFLLSKALGSPTLLSQTEMQKVKDKFISYGKYNEEQ